MARTRPVSGCSSRAWPSSCASTPATSSGEPACCTRPRVRMICPPGRGEGIDEPPVEQHDAHGRAAWSDAAAVEALGEPVERGAARRRLALPRLAGERGDDVAPQHLARLLRHDARHRSGPDAGRAAARRPRRRPPSRRRRRRAAAPASAGARPRVPRALASSALLNAGSATNSVWRRRARGSAARRWRRRAAARRCAARRRATRARRAARRARRISKPRRRGAP